MLLSDSTASKLDQFPNPIQDSGTRRLFVTLKAARFPRSESAAASMSDYNTSVQIVQCPNKVLFNVLHVLLSFRTQTTFTLHYIASAKSCMVDLFPSCDVETLQQVL